MKYIRTFEDIEKLNYDNYYLFTAIRFNNLEKSSELINSGMDLNIRDEEGDTPLIKAVTHGRIQIVKELIDADVDLDIQGKKGNTALIWSSISYNIDIMKLLIEGGCDWNIKNNHGDDFLDYAKYNAKYKKDLVMTYEDIIRIYTDQYNEYLAKKVAEKYNL